MKLQIECNRRNGERVVNVVNQRNNTNEHNFTNNFNIYVKYNIIDMNRYIKQMMITRIPVSLIYKILNWA